MLRSCQTYVHSDHAKEAGHKMNKRLTTPLAISALLLSLRHSAFLVPAYWLMWAVVLGGLAFGIFGL